MAVQPRFLQRLGKSYNWSTMRALGRGASHFNGGAALPEAARQHCLRMATEESIEDQFDGEPTLTERANHAGAHFNLIAESAATGSVPAEIYGEWMNSPEDRSNLLNQQMDRIGVAFIPSHGTLYIVA